MQCGWAGNIRSHPIRKVYAQMAQEHPGLLEVRVLRQNDTRFELEYTHGLTATCVAFCNVHSLSLILFPHYLVFAFSLSLSLILVFFSFLCAFFPREPSCMSSFCTTSAASPNKGAPTAGLDAQRAGRRVQTLVFRHGKKVGLLGRFARARLQRADSVADAQWAPSAVRGTARRGVVSEG